MSTSQATGLIQLSSKKFLIGCFSIACLIIAVSSFTATPFSSLLVASEVFLTIISLFIFGSTKYRLDKNALTYGAVMIISATFWGAWWPSSALRQTVAIEGYAAFIPLLKHYLLTLHGLDKLIHADTMLFILGLTFFVSVIAQTRLLESIAFSVLKKTKGSLLMTVGILTAVVSVASGVLDGVSMIGLMIRILVMILFLARAREASVIYAVMVSTIITTVCGMWLAYGEPPNLIMKTNLTPHLDNAFFIRYCLPIAVGSYCIVLWNLRKKLGGQKIDVAELDILDLHIADVRFLQALKHGEVLIPTEFVDNYQDLLGDHYPAIEKRLHSGEPLGLAMNHEKVPPAIRRELLGHFLSEDLADQLDEYYSLLAEKKFDQAVKLAASIKNALQSSAKQRTKAQWVGGLAFVPFVGLLVAHAIDHTIPLMMASFAGFAVAFLGIVSLKKVRGLSLKEAKHEFSEYLFLLPLFFSITLLQKTGFFGILSVMLHRGIEAWGISHVAYLQFTSATLLSAILDNNVVADFGSRALQGLEISLLHLFSMAQIAGYATGGCWTHIGSAQSVVAYSFIQREISPRFTPFQWIKAITPLIIEIFILITVIVYGESFFASSH